MSNSWVSLVPRGLLCGLLGTALAGALAYGFYSEMNDYSVADDAFGFHQNPEKDKELMGKAVRERYDQMAEQMRLNTNLEMDDLAPSRWLMLLCLAGVIVVVPVLARLYRGLFQQYARRFVFISMLTGLLGAYFAFLTINGAYPMGIDLAGGTELIYRLDFSDQDQKISDAKKELRGWLDRDPELLKNLRPEEGSNQEEAVEKKIRELEALVFGLEEGKRTDTGQATETIRRRIDPTGAKGIPITSFDEGRRLRIQLPRATDEEVVRIQTAIQTQGQLTLNEVANPDKMKETIEAVKQAPTKRTVEWELKVYTPKNPLTQKDDEGRKEELVFRRNPVVGGAHITTATPRMSEDGWQIDVMLDAAGGSMMQGFTAEHVGDRMAIILDGRMVSAPVVKGQFGGRFQITGNFTRDEAKNLSTILTTGSLPAVPMLDSRITVGPRLGHSQIVSGLEATILGGILIALFMWFYYRLCGFASVLCLTLNLALLLGAMGFFKATMTLPGIAGILLTLGMAVDANVLIFERIREERRRGRPLRQAVRTGFDRAFVTIIDSNLTTLITGLILYAMGTGPVRGFAVTLCIGILATLLCNAWVCRLMLEWLVDRDAVSDLQMREFIGQTSFDFMKWRRVAYVLTGSMAIASVVFFISVSDRVFDVDFTGGTLVDFNFAEGKYKALADVRKDTAEKLQPNVKNAVATAAQKFEEFANAAESQKLSGEELRTRLLEEPITSELAAEYFGATNIMNAEKIRKVVGEMRTLTAEFDKSPLDAQAPGSPDEAGRFHNFVLLTRHTAPFVRILLYQELLKLYEADLEPAATSVFTDVVSPSAAAGTENGKDAAAKESVARLRIRFELFSEAELEAMTKEERRTLPDLIRQTCVRLKDRQELKHLEAAFDKLRISAPLKEDYGTRSRYVVDITNFPKQDEDRELMLKALASASIPNRAPGPIARLNSFGPQVAGEQQLVSIFAFIVALVGIWLFVWFRFQFSGAWGLGAIVALLHDAAVALGATCLVSVTGLLPIKVDLNVIAALLSIIGYSVNDTIIIFDRIREVRTAHPTRDMRQVINEAVNATLSRTLLTAGTTIVAVLTLLTLGGGTIRDLAFTLLVGMIVGCYSSIYIASPIMLWWAEKFGFGRVPIPVTKDGQQGGVQI